MISLSRPKTVTVNGKCACSVVNVSIDSLGGQGWHRARSRPAWPIRAKCRAEEIDWPLVCGITLTKIAIAAIGKIGISDCRISVCF
jgi:hypothetical protein